MEEQVPEYGVAGALSAGSGANPEGAFYRVHPVLVQFSGWRCRWCPAYCARAKSFPLDRSTRPDIVSQIPCAHLW